jgi:hypothetical protein
MFSWIKCGQVCDQVWERPLFLAAREMRKALGYGLIAGVIPIVIIEFLSPKV